MASVFCFNVVVQQRLAYGIDLYAERTTAKVARISGFPSYGVRGGTDRKVRTYESSGTTNQGHDLDDSLVGGGREGFEGLPMKSYRIDTRTACGSMNTVFTVQRRSADHTM